MKINFQFQNNEEADQGMVIEGAKKTKKKSKKKRNSSVEIF